MNFKEIFEKTMQDIKKDKEKLHKKETKSKEGFQKDREKIKKDRLKIQDKDK